MNKAFANCATPQEKSNADINAELEISDASGEEDASGPQQNQKGLEYKRSTGISYLLVIELTILKYLLMVLCS